MTTDIAHTAGFREISDVDLLSAIRAALCEAAGPVLTADRLKYFKSDSYRNAHWWRDQCDYLRRSLGPGGQAVILFPVRDPNLGGLTPDDIGLLLQPWLDVGQLSEINADRKWVAAHVSVRREYVALLLHAAPATPAADILDLLKVIPGQTILALSVAWADLLQGILSEHIPDDLSLLGSSGALLAIYVDQRPETARDVRRIARLRKALLRAGISDCGIVFGWNVAIADADLIDRILAHSKFSFSSTFQGHLDQPPQCPDDYALRTGPYFRTGAYYPLPADRRMPRPLRPDSPDIELIRENMCEATDVVRWIIRRDEAFGEQPAILSPLLDYKRREKYMLTLGSAAIQGQWFNEFSPHNWKRETAGIRLFCAEIGTAGAPFTRQVLLAALDMVRHQPWLQFVPPTQLPMILADIANARSLPDADAAQDVQHREHGYLAGNAADNATLPPNIAEFAGFMPEELGATLEIGAGYGLLASAIAGRSSHYTCLDLTSEGFGSLAQGQAVNIEPVVADAHCMPFSSGSFDTVIANNVLEHFYEPVLGLSEIRRVLRWNGRLLALIPLDALNPGAALPAHFWKADLAGVRRLMAKAGFRISRLQIFDANLVGATECFASCRGLHIMVECAPDGMRLLSRFRPRR